MTEALPLVSVDVGVVAVAEKAAHKPSAQIKGQKWGERFMEDESPDVLQICLQLSLFLQAH
ncbi:MAG: hypothetical protein HOP33_03545 [Verrucomicrobia bacterium]|nr:hypothetical protein [Verrucomicrobiota bacterium]